MREDLFKRFRDEEKKIEAAQKLDKTEIDIGLQIRELFGSNKGIGIAVVVVLAAYLVYFCLS